MRWTLLPALLLTATVAFGDDRGLVGHWKLSGDAKDSSGGGNHGRAFSVDLTAPGPDGKPGGAARFDGKTSYIEVPSSPSIELGTGDFTMAVRIHTEALLDDVVGDLASKFDPASRRGFNWCVKSGTGTTISQANDRNLQFGIDSGTEPVWSDRGRPGNAVYVMAMAVHDGQLFVGTCEVGPGESGHVYRYGGGSKWIDCGSPDLCNAVSSLAVHDGKLYAGTGRYNLAGSSLPASTNTNPGGKIVRYDGDGKWADCGRLPDVALVGGMVTFQGGLYAASLYKPAGFFKYQGGDKWERGPLPADGRRVVGLSVFNDHLYAGSYDSCSVYRFDGKTWEDLSALEPSGQTYSFEVHAGELFVATWPVGRVFRLDRGNGGKRWNSAGRLGEELEVMGMAVHNGKLYGGTLPLAEVHRLDGESHWTRTGRLDATPDVRYRRAWTMAVFNGRLFCGTLPSGHVRALDAGQNVSLDRALEPGWKHLVATREGGRLSLFVDGKRVASSDSAPNTAPLDLTNDKPLRIGFGANDYLRGSLSDLRLYNRALAGDEIAALAAATDKGSRLDVSKPTSRVIRVAALGDSITKGVRTGVLPNETFEAAAERLLKENGIEAEIVNVGIGGERTDQALKRLGAVIALQPRVVTVMYGTNDSYVDKGAKASRITVEEYRANLKAIVARLLLAGIEPILMTAPRHADDSPPDGLGDNPNVRLAPFMEACRAVAKESRVPLVDHYAHWTDARTKGQSLGDWTTDGCHPNPRGHRELADALLPPLLNAFRPAPPAVSFTTKLDTVLEHDDGRFLWFHPRSVAVPKSSGGGTPDVLITLQKHLTVSDYYSGLSDLRTADLGKTWDGPRAVAELDWVHEAGGVDVAVADVTPMYHPRSGKVVAVGAQVRYSPKGEQLEDQPRSNQTAYAVYDPKTGRWSKWRKIEMPPGDAFNLARSACAQFVVEDDGSLLLPFYIARSAQDPARVTVARCDFDGETVKYREHGDVLTLDVVRGLCEPSLIRCGDQYYLTIRNDLKGYVTTGSDGLHYRPIKAWTFNDGAELGSYNTQQHWLTHGDGLFLVYTRRGANNDHITRHRAPLFMAQVDKERLQVVRATERVVVPERGASLGNFGASAIGDRESWVTVAEGIWNDDMRRRGAKGAVFTARVLWRDEEAEPRLPKTRASLESGGPVRIVCFGDSVTGVYYHTGSRRAYTDMLGIALRRTYPRADVATVNAGISGNTTRDALARIERDVLKHKPTLVTVMFGLNDMTRIPLDEYRKNLGEIAAKCRAAGAEVLFCTPNSVITTAGRPADKLVAYCNVVREEGTRLKIPVRDVYADLEALRAHDSMDWRLLMSDEIHPNMDGHKRMAESIADAITARPVDLTAVPAPAPALARTGEKLARGEPIRVVAMPPFDQWIGPALEAESPGARVEVTPWPTEGKSLAELEEYARERVRPAAPDLVLLAVPRSANADSLEAFIHGQSWIMNNSLSFGAGGWDCVVVHPSVVGPDPNLANGRDSLIRSLVKAQDLPLIERRSDDKRPAADILREWLHRKPWKHE